MASNWVIRDTGLMGKGVFARVHISKGDKILEEDPDNFISIEKAFEYSEFQHMEPEGMDKKILFAFYLAVVSITHKRSEYSSD